MKNKQTGLISGIKQRQIGPKQSSIRGLLQLRTPSGPQFAESTLEAELIEQLDFSPHVLDIVTQPIITFDDGEGHEKEYAADVFAELFPWVPGLPTYVLLEVKRKADLEKNMKTYENKFRGAEEWCKSNFSIFRVLTEENIQTPYLNNAKVFKRHYRYFPDNKLYNQIIDVVSSKSISVSALIEILGKQGVQEVDARVGIEQAVGNRLIACDLSLPFMDSSLLSEVDSGRAMRGDDQPILATIRDAKNW